jgi:hypothetical protein
MGRGILLRAWRMGAPAARGPVVDPGFVGGRWVGNSFPYNRAVYTVDAAVIHNTYNESLVNPVALNKVSYNGGPGGIPSTRTPRMPAPRRASLPKAAVYIIRRSPPTTRSPRTQLRRSRNILPSDELKRS